jgi:hypothetical protein
MKKPRKGLFYWSKFALRQLQILMRLKARESRLFTNRPIVVVVRFSLLEAFSVANNTLPASQIDVIAANVRAKT